MGDIRETVETAQWSDRELQLRTYYQVVETNGSVRQLQHDVYGCPELGIVGLKTVSAANTEFRERSTAGVRVAYLAGAGLLAGIFTILGLLLTAHF